MRRLIGFIAAMTLSTAAPAFADDKTTLGSGTKGWSICDWAPWLCPTKDGDVKTITKTTE